MQVVKRFWVPVGLCLATAATMVLGVIGFSRVDPSLDPNELVYRSAALLGFSYNGPVNPPVLLALARFTGIVVPVGASLTVVLILFGAWRDRRLRQRACAARQHVVVVGDGELARRMAIAYGDANAAARQPAVVLVTDGEVVNHPQLKEHQVLAVRNTDAATMKKVVKDATTVVVAGSDDKQTKKLLAAVRSVRESGQPVCVVFENPRDAQMFTMEPGLDAFSTIELVAARVLRACRPDPADAVAPAPIVVGDGPIATETLRRIVVGWQEPGERKRVDVITADRGWADEAARELGDRADLHIHVAGTPVIVAREVHQTIAGWRGPIRAGVESTGPSVYVLSDDESTAFYTAHLLVHAHPQARVAVLVDDDHDAQINAVWADADRRPIVVSRRQVLADPSTLEWTASRSFMEEVLLDASLWQDDMPSVVGAIVRDPDETVSLAHQPADVQRVLSALARRLREILRAGNLELSRLPGPQDDVLINNPTELVAMSDAILACLPVQSDTDALRLPALELAARLPALAARAGWTPTRAPGTRNELTPAAVLAMAMRAHALYVQSQKRLRNPTGSRLAKAAWEELADFDQRSNRAQVLGLPVKLALAGLTWRPMQPLAARFGPDWLLRWSHPRAITFEFTAQQVELLAEAEHRRWTQHQRRNGRGGHELAVPWAVLSEGKRQLDRDPVLGIPESLAVAGLEIVPMDDATSEVVGPLDRGAAPAQATR